MHNENSPENVFPRAYILSLVEKAIDSLCLTPDDRFRKKDPGISYEASMGFLDVITDLRINGPNIGHTSEFKIQIEFIAPHITEESLERFIAEQIATDEIFSADWSPLGRFEQRLNSFRKFFPEKKAVYGKPILLARLGSGFQKPTGKQKFGRLA